MPSLSNWTVEEGIRRGEVYSRFGLLSLVPHLLAVSLHLENLLSQLQTPEVTFVLKSGRGSSQATDPAHQEVSGRRPAFPPLLSPNSPSRAFGPPNALRQLLNTLLATSRVVVALYTCCRSLRPALAAALAPGQLTTEESPPRSRLRRGH
ncbi:hypothetical protein C6P46_002396 [Rhodotorula mucilaginosa]|uniref:Uncharacterized protein n=1 Tax=Rhodotorula mucilaginosa TaxID=5537 RepID=A0A9P6W4G6_RHOMI|nr:hypothetical protein C6P46_002396 [Rhodotorula mucilaginosa]